MESRRVPFWRELHTDGREQLRGFIDEYSHARKHWPSPFQTGVEVGVLRQAVEIRQDLEAAPAGVKESVVVSHERLEEGMTRRLATTGWPAVFSRDGHAVAQVAAEHRRVRVDRGLDVLGVNADGAVRIHQLRRLAEVWRITVGAAQQQRHVGSRLTDCFGRRLEEQSMLMLPERAVIQNAGDHIAGRVVHVRGAKLAP